MRAGAFPAEVESGSPSEDAMCLERFRFPLKLKPLTPNERSLRNCSQKASVAHLDLPAKCRASPLRNVRIIDLLKVEKACL